MQRMEAHPEIWEAVTSECFPCGRPLSSSLKHETWYSYSFMSLSGLIAITFIFPWLFFRCHYQVSIVFVQYNLSYALFCGS